MVLPHTTVHTINETVDASVFARWNADLSTSVGRHGRIQPGVGASKIAKKNPDLGGVCDLSDEAERSRWMAKIPLGPR